jgi:dCMP deaminase
MVPERLNGPDWKSGGSQGLVGSNPTHTAIIMKPKHIRAYMNVAHEMAKCSTAQRLKVGAVVVKDHQIFVGYNGTPDGWDNTCEDTVWMSPEDCYLPDSEQITKWPYIGTYTDDNGKTVTSRYKLVTKPETLHAESNCLAKMAKSPTSASDNACMFITHSPCMECAKLIYQAGIKQVYYKTAYRSQDGVYFLQRAGVNISQYIENNE